MLLRGWKDAYLSDRQVCACMHMDSMWKMGNFWLFSVCLDLFTVLGILHMILSLNKCILLWKSCLVTCNC